jgi:hypothetical protein
MKAFEIWEQDGFDAVAALYLGYLATDADATRKIDENGDCLVGEDRFALLPAIESAAWRDPTTGGVRL